MDLRHHANVWQVSANVWQVSVGQELLSVVLIPGKEDKGKNTGPKRQPAPATERAADQEGQRQELGSLGDQQADCGDGTPSWTRAQHHDRKKG